MKCEICGCETMKGRKTCKGCRSIKKIAKSGQFAPKTAFKDAEEHLKKKPDLINIISFKSFFKKNKKVIV